MKHATRFNAPPTTFDLTFDLQRFAELSLTLADGYYQIGSKDDLQTLADYVNGGGDTSGLKFKLTANIGGVDFHIGTADNMFKGTFEGDGKKITVNYNSTTENCALFNYIDGATITTLTVDGTINTSAKCAAGIAAQANGSCYIQNCTSSVTINSTVSGDGTHGGFVAVNNWWISIKNCIFNGKLLGENTNSCGGFIGWNGNIANVNFTNLFAPTEITIGTEDSATLFRGKDSGNDSGCYTQTFGTAQGTQAYKLNTPLPEGVTTSDTLTFGDTTYLKASGTLNYNGKAYSYSVTGDTTITLDDGKLYVNGAELKLAFLDTLDKDSDGYYLIGTLEQLQGFATYANEQADYLEGKKFKLTANITLPTVAEGASNWTAINSFKGEFNGDNHTIDNMTIHTTGAEQGCLFHGVNTVGYGKVCNLNLTNINISGNYGLCGGIAYYNSGTIENCNVTGSIQGTAWLGGIAAKNSGIIKNCFADVEISNVSCAGAIVGEQYTDGKIYSTNYHSDRNISGGGNNGAGYIEESTCFKYYRLNLPEGVTASGDGVKEYCGKYYFSSEGTTVTLSKAVGDITTFTTLAEDMTIAPLSLNGGGTENNPYQIATADDLKTLATYVNTGNDCAGKYFKLTGDINMSGVSYTAIGTANTNSNEVQGNAFKGTFDGGGFTISNLTINKANDDFQGLFGHTDGATIKNFKITVNINAYSVLGAVVGYANNSTIDNVTATGSISGKGGIGGLIGWIRQSSVNNCKVDVQVSGNNSHALFSFWGADSNLDAITVSNCYYHGSEQEEIENLTGTTKIYKLTIPAGVTASGSFIEFGGNTYAAENTQVTLTVNGDNGFEKITGISGATANGTNYTCTVGTSDLEFKLEGYPKIGNLAFDAATNIYSIGSVADLQALANFVNAGNNCAGFTFKVTANIDLGTAGTWNPIGNLDNPFKGTFDGGNGDGYAIGNLRINTPGKSLCGLFGYVEGGTVKNVTLLNANVTGLNCVGGLVGYNSGGSVEGCIVDATVAGNEDVGGIVGIKFGGGTVTNNTFHSNAVAVGNGGTNNTRVYLLTLNGAEVSGGETVNIGGTTYYKGGEVTLSTKTGYTVDSPVTIDSDKTITATLDDKNHYVLADNTSTLATAANTKDYPDLVQVYALTLPEGVTAQGDSITIGDTTYYSGTVTFAGVKAGYTIDSVTLTQDTAITATLDDKNHYVLADNTSTLATAANTKDYPDLVQVYQLTLPQGVTAQGSIVITDGDKTYAVGNITLNAEDGYTLENVIVNGKAISGNTFTVDGNANITADVTAIADEPETKDLFNAAGTAVVVNGTTGDFHANSTLYTITASQENSTLIANAKANQIIIEGGNENILTGGKGNDTFKFEAGGGIVTDYGIGATKSGNGKALATANGTDIVKVDGTVTGIYFDRDASTKKSATFTATIVYGDNQVVVLKDIAKKPTKTNSNPSKAIYQTNDVAAATLKIWDTSGSKQAVISSTNLKKLFHDDSDDAFTDIIKEKTDYLVKLSEGNTPENNPFEVTPNPEGGIDDGDED